MLGIKESLTKILESIATIKGRRATTSVDSATVTLASGETKWMDPVAIPNNLDGKDVRLAGYYVSGSQDINIYCLYIIPTHVVLAVKNTSSGNATFKITVYLQY